MVASYYLYSNCRTPRGVRGLKLSHLKGAVGSVGRTPRGVRGLKYVVLIDDIQHELVAPLAGCVD